MRRTLCATPEPSPTGRPASQQQGRWLTQPVRARSAQAAQQQHAHAGGAAGSGGGGLPMRLDMLRGAYRHAG